MTPEQQKTRFQCQAFKAWLEKQSDLISKEDVRFQAEKIFMAAEGKRPNRRKRAPKGGIPITYCAQG